MPYPGSIYIHTWVSVLQWEKKPSVGILQVKTSKGWEITLLLPLCFWGEGTNNVSGASSQIEEKKYQFPLKQRPYLQRHLPTSAVLRVSFETDSSKQLFGHVCSLWSLSKDSGGSEMQGGSLPSMRQPFQGDTQMCLKAGIDNEIKKKIMSI